MNRFNRLLDSFFSRPRVNRRRGRKGLPRSAQPNVPRFVETLENRVLLSATAIHHYELNDSLADALGGPALVSHGGTLDGERYVFGFNQGLQLFDALPNTADYSIEIVMEFDSTSPLWKKVIDFQERAIERGLYVRGNQLTLYPSNVFSSDTITPNTDFHFVLTRNAATGEAKGYLNGVLQWSVTGTASDYAVPANNVLTFFEDDLRTGREAQSGSADFITIYDGPLNADEVRARSDAVHGGENTAPDVTVDRSSVAVDEGGTASNSGQFSDVDPDDVVRLTASVGTITHDEGDSGNWSWSFDTADGPAESQTVVVTAVDARGGETTVSFHLTVNNVVPTVDVSGPASGLKGETLEFILGATDGSSVDQADGFTYDIDWNGDGVVDQSVSGTGTQVVTHAFATPGPTTVVVTATDKDNGTSVETTHTIDVVQPVDVDLTPGGRRNPVNLRSLRLLQQNRSKAFVPVVLMTTPDFDASTVDLSTVVWAGAGVHRSRLKDVDGDGDLDLVLRFRLADTNLLDLVRESLLSGDRSSQQTITVELSGATTDGISFASSSDVDLFMSRRAMRRLLNSV